jgi:ABC-type Mn2+/Zn2+ transport system ATPase subunit
MSPGPSTPLFEARELSVGYARRAPVQTVSFTVMPGELWYIVGPNGAGKSTLLRTLIGLLAPLSGVLEVRPDLRRRGAIGYAPQRASLKLNAPLTVFEAVALAAESRWLLSRSERERVQALLDELQLSELARRDLARLSGGEMQRVLLARALLRDPVLLALDEPAAFLDIEARRRWRANVETLRRERGLAAIVVSHEDPAKLSASGAKLLILDGAAAPPDALASDVRPAGAQRP